MRRFPELSAREWNGVRLYQGETNGSVRARLVTVAEDRFQLFLPFLEKCHAGCEVEEIKPDIYFQKGSKDLDYTEQRLMQIANSGRLATSEIGRLAVYEVTPDIAEQTLKLLSLGNVVVPHPDGIY